MYATRPALPDIEFSFFNQIPFFPLYILSDSVCLRPESISGSPCNNKIIKFEQTYFMSSLKDRVLQMVSAIDDEQLLELIKADIEYFASKGADILDELEYADMEELLNLVNEPDEKDTLNEEEYKAATAQWRTR